MIEIYIVLSRYAITPKKSHKNFRIIILYIIRKRFLSFIFNLH